MKHKLGRALQVCAGGNPLEAAILQAPDSFDA